MKPHAKTALSPALAIVGGMAAGTRCDASEWVENSSQDTPRPVAYTVKAYTEGSDPFDAMNPGDNPPIGIVLCTDKGADLVRYTLPLHNKRIFAAKYKLHLPSEQELIAELRRERTAIEDAQLVTKLDQGETRRIKKSAFGTDGKSVRMV